MSTPSSSLQFFLASFFCSWLRSSGPLHPLLCSTIFSDIHLWHDCVNFNVKIRHTCQCAYVWGLRLYIKTLIPSMFIKRSSSKPGLKFVWHTDNANNHANAAFIQQPRTQKLVRTAELALQSILVLSMSAYVKPNGVRNSKHFSSDANANSAATKLTGKCWR